MHVYSNPSGENEGKKFIAERTIGTDAFGKASFTFSPSSKVPVGRTTTATVLDVDQLTTSEFSLKRFTRSQTLCQPRK